MAQENSDSKSLKEINIHHIYQLIHHISTLFKDNDNSFSLKHKLFYGILASSEIGSNILFEHFKKKYLSYGGDTSWIEKGIKNENISKYIKVIAKMNDILVHKPWILFLAHFAKFYNGMTFFSVSKCHYFNYYSSIRHYYFSGK